MCILWSVTNMSPKTHVYIPRDAVIMRHSQQSPVVFWFAFPGSALFPLCLSASMKLSHNLLLCLFNFPGKAKSSLQCCVGFFFRIVSPPLLMNLEEKGLVVCSRLVLTPLGFVWRVGQRERRRRGRECNPLPLPSLADHWALFLLSYCQHFPPIRRDSSRVRGHMCLLWATEKRWWAGGWAKRGGGGSPLWPLCQGMCLHSHHLLATKARRHKLTTSPAMCLIPTIHKSHRKAPDRIVSSGPLFSAKGIALSHRKGSGMNRSGPSDLLIMEINNQS